MIGDRQRAPIILSSSPVEFVITGPSFGRDRLLLKSSNVGLDVIALAADPHLNVPQTADILALFFGDFRQLNVVQSQPLEDFESESDHRLSSVRFGWRGYASSLSIKRVNEALMRSMPDLMEALRSRRKADAEWAIAPVVYACLQAQERRLRSRRVFLSATVLYGLIGLVALVYLLTMKHLPELW